MRDEPILTPAEEAEFTLLNMTAFDLIKKNARDNGTVLACWLCMSEEARATARAALLREMNQLFRTAMTEAALADLIDRTLGTTGEDLLASWRSDELAAKSERAGR
jgi:hypothetical protein